jgi:hypothetical protein
MPLALGVVTLQSHSGTCNPDLYRQNTNKIKMKIRILAALTAIASLATPAFAGPKFSDASPTNWAHGALQNLAEKYGCVVGYSDGTFRGSNSTSRYESVALVSACIDRVYDSLSQADRRIADEARAAIAVTNARVSALEDTATRKAVGVGSYVGAGVNLNRQGVSSDAYSNNRTVAGATLQGRSPLGNLYGVSTSARPYVNFAAGPDSQIGSALGVLGTVDVSLAGRTIGGIRVSSTNLYLGAGGQWALTNDGQANYQTSVGQGSQFLFVAGVERAFTSSLVGFADLKFPTQENGVTGTAYAPVGTVGLGFKF